MPSRYLFPKENNTVIKEAQSLNSRMLKQTYILSHYGKSGVDETPQLGFRRLMLVMAQYDVHDVINGASWISRFSAESRQKIT